MTGSEADPEGLMRDETKRSVDAFVADLHSQRVNRAVAAIVVCGSAARGEEKTSGEAGASDIDVMLITHSRSPVVGRKLSRIVARHSTAGIEGGQVPAATLRLHRTLLNFEARHTGRVVDGDPRLLELVPMTCPEDIPLWEACRLLCNRLFEHLKLAAGLATPEGVTTKTYEALGEAQLVLERRYRPSFRLRLDEVRSRPFADPRLTERFLGSVSCRFSGSSIVLPDVAVAREDLLAGAASALRSLSGLDGPLEDQLAWVGSHERNLVHRTYWAALTRRPVQLLEDPSVSLWRSAVRVLTGASAPDVLRLITDWQRCPQILRPRAPEPPAASEGRIPLVTDA